MTRFLAKRFFMILATIWLLATFTFFLLHIVPGGPFDSDKQLPADIKANIEAKFQMNKSVSQQYLDYLKGVAAFDFGPSYKYSGRNVREIIIESLPVSMELGIYAIFFAVLLGIPLGMLAAYRQNSWIDFSAMFFAVAGISMPTYLLGAFLVYVFSLRLQWFPAALWEDWRSLVLPIISLGIRPLALVARLTRASLLENIRTDYIRTARAKGLSEILVVFKHALKNSLVPVLALLGPLSAYILTGTFVVEYIFAIPGLGRHFINAVSDRDYPLIMGVTMVFGFALVLGNIMVDLAYAWLDPRLRS